MTLPRTPALATDCVIFDPLGRVPLIRRGHEPCAGKHALCQRGIHDRAHHETQAQAGSDAGSAEWVDMCDIDLAFDHARIFSDAKARLRIKAGRLACARRG